jgi:hypothetical protein
VSGNGNGKAGEHLNGVAINHDAPPVVNGKAAEHRNGSASDESSPKKTSI